MSQKAKKTKKRVAARRRLFAVGILAAVALCVCAGLTLLRTEPQRAPVPASAVTAEPTAAPTATPTAAPTPVPTPLVQTVRFSASGDDLVHAPIYQQAAARAGEGQKYDFSYVYENLAGFYEQFDVNWINQETIVNNELAPSTYPCFSTPGECAEALYALGIRVFALSNNHSYDKGAAGLAATRRFWADMPEDTVTTGLWSGPEDYDTIPMHTVNGISIAYLAYTETTNGLPDRSDFTAHVIYTSQTDVMEAQIRRARELADVVVVGVHWGVEYSHKANDAQKALAQNFADWGADLIIGTHPHVVQDAAWLTAADGREVFVAYSLGNFISTQNEKNRLVGLLLSAEFRKVTEPDGAVTVAVCTPTLMPVVTHYDNNRANVRNYLLRDYTEELALHHGLRSAKYANFCRQDLVNIIEANVSEEFLAPDWNTAA